jgi:hypothetical protein
VTANKKLSALRGVFNAAWRLRQISKDDYQWAIDLDRNKESVLLASRALTVDEISALLEVCQSHFGKHSYKCKN